MMEIRGKRVLITGASRGIGESLAYAFAEAGATGALVARTKDAIETLFDVKVESVNIINTPAKRGRRSRSRRLMVRRAGYKKAIVTLQAGQTLQIFEGVQ